MSERQPFFSVVMPAYNTRQYIGRALDSVLAQDEDTETIVVDDGSTDGIGEFVEQRYPSVRCIRAAHAGASAARNLGIAQATGVFVALLDSDDQWLGGHLRRLRRLLEADGLMWACADWLDGDARGEMTRRPPSRLARRLGDDGGVVEDYFAACGDGARVSSSTVAFHRDTVARLGGFCRDLTVGEDLDMWFRLALECPRMGYIPQPGGVYWRREGSATVGMPPWKLQSMLRRLQRDWSLAAAAGPDALRRARPLLMRWMGKAVQLSIEGGHPSMLRELCKSFGRQIPLKWRLASRVCRATPAGCWPLVGRLALAGSRDGE
jgi:GT2 family glycosyltransferase